MDTVSSDLRVLKSHFVSAPLSSATRLNKALLRRVLSWAPPKLPPASKPTWWAGVASGGFPQPLKRSPGVTVWRVEDIHALIAQPRGV